MAKATIFLKSLFLLKLFPPSKRISVHLTFVHVAVNKYCTCKAATGVADTVKNWGSRLCRKQFVKKGVRALRVITSIRDKANQQTKHMQLSYAVVWLHLWLNARKKRPSLLRLSAVLSADKHAIRLLLRSSKLKAAKHKKAVTQKKKIKGVACSDG